MNTKPTCEELEHRIRELEEEIVRYKRMEKAQWETEERYQSLADLSPDPIVVSQDGRLQIVNTAFVDLFGYSQQDLDDGMDIIELINEQDRETVRKRYENRIRGKDVPKRLIIDLIAKSGRIIPCETSAGIVPLNGRPAVVVIVRDIRARKQAEEDLRKVRDELELRVEERTAELSRLNEQLNREIDERKAVEKALSESEERYRLLFENAGALIQVFDNKGVCRMINGTAANCYEGTAEDFVGKSFHELQLEDADEYLKRVQDIANSGKGRVYDELVKLPSGKERWMLSNSQPIRDSSGRIFAVQIISQDITERRWAEEALREREEKYRDLVETLNDIIWEVDIDGRFTYLSPKVHEVLGYHPDELIGKPFFDIMTPDESIRVSDIFDEFISEPKVFAGIETKPLHKDGYEVILENNGKPFFSPDGVLLGYRGVDRDITQRKQAEKALSESEKEYRNLFHSIPDPVVIVQENFNILFNQAFTKLFGFDGHDLEKGLSPFNLIKEDDAKEIARKRIAKRLAGELVTPEFDYVDLMSKDGKSIPCEGRGTLIQYKGKPADLVIFRDITERKRAEELIRSLSHQLLKSQENERQMISRELHDRVAQDLSISRINCEILLGYKSLTPEVRKKISEISDSLRATLMTARDLSYDLRPPGLEELGLIQTLSEFCNEFSEKNEIGVDFLSAGMNNVSLDYGTNINLYRLVQEGLNNVRKHADASNVMVKLIASFPKIILRIEDNGKGFDVKERLAAASKEKRMGLQSMEERVALLRGKISIQSFPKKGTKILIEVPYIDE